MASWLTHMRIAERIKQKVEGIDFSYLMMGSIAPGSSISCKDQENQVSSGGAIYCSNRGNSDMIDIDENMFFEGHLVPEKIMTRSDSTRSFLWGYYFHLLTDRLWLEECVIPFKEMYENEFKDTEIDFFDLIDEEMFSIDFEYLEDKGKELIDNIKDFEGNTNFINEFDFGRIHECKNYIVNFYSIEDFCLDREYKYLKPQLVEDFIARVSKKCISILIV